MKESLKWWIIVGISMGASWNRPEPWWTGRDRRQGQAATDGHGQVASGSGGGKYKQACAGRWLQEQVSAPTCPNLRSSWRGLNWVQVQTPSKWSPRKPYSLQSAPWNSSCSRNTGQGMGSKGKGSGGEPPISWIQLQGQPQSMFLPWPPPKIMNNALHKAIKIWALNTILYLASSNYFKY